MENKIKVKASALGVAALATLAGCASNHGSRSVVVYYSASGATETVARLIQKKTGADIVKITPPPLCLTEKTSTQSMRPSRKRWHRESHAK